LDLLIEGREELRNLTGLASAPPSLAEIAGDPVRMGYFLAIRELVGEGHDQYVDDMYTGQHVPSRPRPATSSTSSTRVPGPGREVRIRRLAAREHR
jgi:hypothetical protein